MLNKFKIGTTAALLALTTSCTGQEKISTKPEIPENSRLCQTESFYIRQLSDAIIRTRFLDFTSQDSIRRSINQEDLSVVNFNQNKNTTNNPFGKTIKSSWINLRGGISIFNEESLNDANKSTGETFSANYGIERYLDSLLLSYYDEGILFNYGGEIKPSTPDNQKIVIQRKVSGV